MQRLFSSITLWTTRKKEPAILKTRSDLHLARKIWHVCGVLVIIALYTNLSRDSSIRLAIAVTFIVVGVDMLRQQFAGLNQLAIRAFRPFMREHERQQIAGLSWMLLGVFTIVYLFPHKITLLSLWFLAIGDPIASYVGIRIGRDKLIGAKSLQGTLAAFVACTFTAAGYFYFYNLMTGRVLIASVLAGLIGAVAELVPIRKLDDNLTFPIVSASLLAGLFFLFGGG